MKSRDRIEIVEQVPDADREQRIGFDREIHYRPPTITILVAERIDRRLDNGSETEKQN